MKKIFFIFIIIWGFSTQIVFAQEIKKLDTKVKDSVVSKINPLAPSKAAFYSAILPGLGQAYNKKYWKIPILYTGLGISIYSYTWNQKKYHEFRDEYKRRLDGTADPNHPIYGGRNVDYLVRGQKFHQRNRDLSMLMTVGIYILNIVDANVDAHLLQFNVNDDLSIKPDLNQNYFDYKHNVGLTLTYNF